MTRVVFMGTPEFAVPSLKALCDAGYDVVGVFTQPDRPAGRGRKLTACPVKLEALKRGLPVFQFEKVKAPEGVAQLRALQPDVTVTAAFGQILTQEILDIPTRGTVNVHASLLPKHRGSAPINWCILNGDREAGVTLMLTDVGIDNGDMLTKVATPVGELETAGELTGRLSALGAELLRETLPKYLAGEIVPEKQDEALSSYEPMLKKEMGEIDWTRDARSIANQVRGLNPWPCACTGMAGGWLKIYLARAVETDSDAAPGTVLTASPKAGLVVKCGAGALEVLEMQAPGAKRMAAKAYLAGRRIDEGSAFGKDVEA
ncbi:MAG: methionyl-tRNA formyltransferase [Clostridia bacterium]|nr:methionyl-tRNA formyltransferase [Clostridia bacterium]